MSEQPIEANVVLTAETDAYNRSMQESAERTNSLASAVDRVSSGLGSLSKSAGKKISLFAAADMASITAATAAYGAYEQQMESLQVQANVMSQTMEGQKRLFKEYEGAVRQIRGEFGATTRESAALVQSISQMSDKTADISGLAESYVRLSAATGESSVVLQQSMTQLQRSMGTPQRDTDRMNNSLLTLSMNSNASAQGILEFSQSIAPVGRLVNMSQQDIMGFSTAFLKAGQDGYQAGNVFNKMLSNIAYATQTGSPDLHTYANLVGMTVDNFKELSGTDKFLKIFDSINRQGPQAITTLNRMGLDGMRTVRTVTAMAQQGGMREEILRARNADPDNLKSASDEAFSGLADQLKRIRSEVAMTGEALGENLAGSMSMSLTVMEKFSGVVKDIASGPLGDIATFVANIGVAAGAILGPLFMAGAALMQFSAFRMAMGSSFRHGVAESRRGIARDAGTVGSRIHGTGPNSGNWLARSLYTGGERVGRYLPGPPPPGSPGMFSRAVGYAAYGAGWGANMVGQMYSPGTIAMVNPLTGQRVPGTGGFNDPSARTRLMTSPTFAGTMSGVMTPFRWGQAQMQDRMINRTFGARDGGRIRFADAHAMNRRFDQLSQSKTAGLTSHGEKMDQAYRETITRTDAAMKEMNRTVMTASKGFGNFAKGMGSLSMMMMAAGGGVVKQGTSLISKTAGHAGALIGNNPLLGAALGAFAVYQLAQQDDLDYSKGKADESGLVNTYTSAAGGKSLPKAGERTDVEKKQVTRRQALDVTDAELAYVTSEAYKPTTDRFEDKPLESAMSSISANWTQLSQDPEALNNVVNDLIHEYGANEGLVAIQELSARGSEAPDLAMHAEKIANPGTQGVRDKLVFNESGEVAIERINDAMGAIEDRAAYIQATQGEQAALDYRAQARIGLFDEFAAAPDTSKTREDYEVNEVMAETFYKDILGVDKSFEGIMGHLGAKSIKIGEEATTKDWVQAAIAGGPAPIKGLETGGLPVKLPQLEEEELVTLLEAKGLDPSLRGQDAVDAIWKWLNGPEGTVDEEERNSARNKIKRMSGDTFGPGGLLEMPSVKKAIDSGGEDPNKEIRAMQDITRRLNATDMTTGEKIKELTNLSAASGDDESMGAGQLANAQNLIRQQSSFAMPYMSRTDQFAEQTDIFKNEMTADVGGKVGETKRQEAQALYQQQVMGQYDYFKGLLLAQREFEVSRRRAEDDYNQQKEWQQEDYDRSREHAYFDFNLQRSRAEEDFDRQRRRQDYDYQKSRERAEFDQALQMKRAYTDFHISRKRQQEDYEHSVERMVATQAKSMHNIYERISVQSTSSAGWLAVNAQDQLEQMQEQSKNLQKLRNMGVNDNVIEQLGLSDTENAQQLDRFVGDLQQDPRKIKQFNNMVKKRLKAAENLVTDESSAEWKEFQRQYRLARNRAQDDFDRSMRRARQDFRRGLDRQDEDYRLSLNRQQEDFSRGMKHQQTDFERMMDRQAEQYSITVERQREQYGLTMKRAANDLKRQAKEITGDFEEILEKSVKKLSGHAKRQAKTVLQEYRDLKNSTRPEAVELMEALAAIFGVDYTPPGGRGGRGGGGGPGSGHQNAPGNDGFGAQDSMASGGVLPGRSIGRDNMHFYSKEHGALHLAGGEAIMVPEWVDQVGGPTAVKEMNQKARSTGSSPQQGRSFARGGAIPAVGEWSAHSRADYPWARWAGDINVPGPSDFGNPVRAYKDGIIAAMKDIGDQSYGRYIRINHPETNEETLYAHLSKFGDAWSVGDRVNRGQIIGRVGDYGESYGPHLHFEIKGGTSAIDFGGGSGGGSRVSINDILKDRYPALEAKIAKFAGNQVLQNGDWSGIINKMARQKYKLMVEKYGVPTSGAASHYPPIGMWDLGEGSNQQIVRRAMRKAGWEGQWPALYELMMRESGFDNHADNPSSTAYGMFQFLDKTWPQYGIPKTSDPTLQAIAGMRYIRDRYGDPRGALAWHNQVGWYGDGAVFANGAQTIGVGERGPEMVLPLNERGADFINEILRKSQVGNEAKDRHSRHGTCAVGRSDVTNNYQVDKSTTFSGPITVEAQNPQQLIHQLQQRQRIMAIGQPQLNRRVM